MKVVVAMSGGVDSSVAAALLKQAGHEVIGITMQVHPDEEVGEPRRFGGCCGVSDVLDAARVARKLDMRHYVVNFREVFTREVIDDFCREYLAGRTPNPCIRCNRYLKFDALLTRARQLDADRVATGHYAQIEFDEDSRRYRLLKGVDGGKDQSYVLYGMTQEQLGRSLFPIGELTKREVRDIAGQLDLPVADKPESQDICFVADDDYAGFVAKHTGREPLPGPILDAADGRVLGEHRGIASYTVGQRRGLGITTKGAEPRYVVAIDPERNAVIVGAREEVYGDELTASTLNWIAFDRLEAPIAVTAKIRYRHEAAAATVAPLGGDDVGDVGVSFREPQPAIAPGQAVVFYDGDVVVGGGSIARVAQGVVA